MMTIASAMFDSPNLGNQSTNINHIASQGEGSLLDGGVPVKLDTLTNTVTSSYGITGNQSDKLSSGYSVNIPAQPSAKVSAGQSAKFYAGLKYETPSYPNPDIPNRGEITPFKGFIGVTARGDIEFCESIKKDCVEFLESIKKGSVSATLCVFDIKYRANQYGDFSLNLRYSKYQSFASIPRLSNSLRSNRLIHPDLLSSPSAFMAIARRSDNSLSRRNCTTWRSLTSFVDTVNSCGLTCNGVDNVLHCMTFCKAKPRSVGSLTGLLITSDTETIEVTMNKHITPVTGRNSLTPNQSFRWLFLALERGNPAAKPYRIEATAPSEHSARLLLVHDYILAFAGRVPVREVAA